MSNASFISQQTMGSNRPSRLTTRTQSLLDWILVSHPNGILKSGVMSDCFSDHSIVYCIWKLKLSKLPPRLIKSRQYKKLNLDFFINDFITINWNRYQLKPNVQDTCDFLYTEFNDVVDKHASWKTVKVKGKHLPWIDSDLISLFRQREKAWSTFRQTKDIADWEKYRQTYEQDKTRNAKSNYYKECLTYDFKNPQQFWNKIKSIINTSNKHSVNQIRVTNTVLHDTICGPSIQSAFLLCWLYLLDY